MNKTMIQGSALGLFVLSAMLSTGANADCPISLPAQLLEDCITAEGSGADFPYPSYAYKEQYMAWLASQTAHVQDIKPAAGGHNSSLISTSKALD